MKEAAKKHESKLRFTLVGAANTALDFMILFVLVGLGLDRVFSNFISTSTAFLSSFFANRSFTFKAKNGNAKKQFSLFLIITLFGLWVIQPIVIELCVEVLEARGTPNTNALFIGKLLATLVTLTWNYLFYSRLVFKNRVEQV